jgi:hypothetical protein
MRYARLLASLLLIFILLAVGSQLLRHVLPTSESRKETRSEPAGVGAGTGGVGPAGGADRRHRARRLVDGRLESFRPISRVL